MQTLPQVVGGCSAAAARGNERWEKRGRGDGEDE